MLMESVAQQLLAVFAQMQQQRELAHAKGALSSDAFDTLANYLDDSSAVSAGYATQVCKRGAVRDWAKARHDLASRALSPELAGIIDALRALNCVQTISYLLLSDYLRYRLIAELDGGKDQG